MEQQQTARTATFPSEHATTFEEEKPTARLPFPRAARASERGERARSDAARARDVEVDEGAEARLGIDDARRVAREAQRDGVAQRVAERVGVARRREPMFECFSRFGALLGGLAQRVQFVSRVRDLRVLGRDAALVHGVHDRHGDGVLAVAHAREREVVQRGVARGEDGYVVVRSSGAVVDACGHTSRRWWSQLWRRRRCRRRRRPRPLALRLPGRKAEPLGVEQLVRRRRDGGRRRRCLRRRRRRRRRGSVGVVWDKTGWWPGGLLLLLRCPRRLQRRRRRRRRLDRRRCLLVLLLGQRVDVRFVSC
mmetsp:Transcript_4226/g.17114  ORF Transcript_4226/g.17114 Transcript_4226/m.17114 type:complete len:308 (+) Transcript_4226:146-1069(+)